MMFYRYGRPRKEEVGKSATPDDKSMTQILQSIERYVT